MKEKKFIFILLTIISASLVLYYFLGRSGQAPIVHNKQKRPSYRIKMEGLSFLAMDSGRKAIAIRADRFIVKNMKVGYFTFSMATVAFLENVSINVYSKGKGAMRKSGQKDALDFKGVISKEVFASFPAKKIVSIVAAPIVFTLYDDETMITQISAKTATVSFRNNDVVFDDDVRVVSGQSQLRCESLRLSPADGIMEAKKFRLAREGKNTAGRHLKTDLLLKRHT